MNILEVPKIIRDYVQTAGGEVTIEDLTSDFKIAYGTHIPFDGYPDLFSFLNTIRGVKLQEMDGCYYLVTQKRSPLKPVRNISNESDEVANICVQVSNNLVIRDGSGKRNVSLKSSVEQTNSRSRRLILNKMNHYSRASTESTTNDLKESTSNLCSSNYPEYSSKNTTNTTFSDYLPQDITNSSFSTYSPRNITNSKFPPYSSQNVESSTFPEYSSQTTANSTFPEYSPLNHIDSLFPEYSSKNSLSSTSNNSLYHTDESTNSTYETSNSVTPEGSTLEYQDNFYSPCYDSNSTTNSSSIWSKYTENMYYLLLVDLASKYNLELPRLETSTNISSDSGIIFTTMLKVGNENFISPSYTGPSAKQIYEDLFKNAYESVKKKFEVLDVRYDYDVVTQIIEIINLFRNGVDVDTIEAEYIKKYRMSLPPNWINLVESSSSIYIETLPNYCVMYPTRLFLTITPFFSSLPARVYPNVETWNIIITNVVNANEIHFRILDDHHVSRYQSLLDRMRQHYDGIFTGDVKNVKPNELYASCIEGEWYRVEVLSSQTNNVECLLVDVGTQKTLPIASLFPLNHKFTNTPPLANRCSMARLIEYQQVNYISCKLKQMLFNEIATAKVDVMNDDELSLIIYLKNDKVNVNVNQYFLNKVRKELSTRELDEIGQFYDVSLLSLDDSGLARIQVESDSLYLLKQSLDKASQKIEKNGTLGVTSSSKLDLEKIYLAKIDHQWERIKIKNYVNNVEVNVECIDTGDVKVIAIKKIVPTDHLPDTLLHISPQLQEVQIAPLDDINRKIIKFINRFNLHGTKLTLNVIKTDPKVEVELYKKLSNEQTMPLRNVYMSNYDRINNLDFMNYLNNILPAHLYFELFSNCDNITNAIPRYDIPKGSTLRVRVMKVLNPSNFVLKIDTRPEFAELMLNLNNFYLIFSPKPAENISAGSCYVVKLENGLWYRGLALFILEETVIVHLLDFGETVSMNYSSVYPILPEFYSLPVQTFSAQLLNVKPAQNEWTPEDCCRFKEIVYQKVLNCIVVENTTPMMQVILLDGSSNNEMKNVSSMLLDERRAIS